MYLNVYLFLYEKSFFTFQNSLSLFRKFIRTKKMEFLPTQNLSEKNQNLHSENRRLRERLLELYVQINTLNSISEDLGIKQSQAVDQSRYQFFNQNKGLYKFIQSENIVLPGGAIFSADLEPAKGENVAIASHSGTLSILSSQPGLKVASTIEAHSLACRDVYWNSSGSLVSCGFDKKIKFWDFEKSVSVNDIDTEGLAHSICGFKDDPNNVFVAAGEQIYWIDRRRQTPITISAESVQNNNDQEIEKSIITRSFHENTCNRNQATAVTCFKDLLLYGGYDGYISIVDRRSLHAGIMAHLDIQGGPISSLSRVLDIGKCIVTSSFKSPEILVIGDTVEQTELKMEAPGRFGCRSDITDKSLIFNGDFATVCGGKMAVFWDGAPDSEPQTFDEISGFVYGALFITNISQKVLTYNEDGVVSIWSLRQL